MVNSYPAISELTIAILLPCYNEELAIVDVINEFRDNLPLSTIYVYDNNSTDNTANEALKANAIVRNERLQGKGHVIRRMFADVEADVYVMADGDGTYDAAVVGEMIGLLVQQNLDMVVGTRDGVYANAHRRGHGIGNLLFNKMYHFLFGRAFTDIFSGYRIFSRRFVKSFPAISSGFEIETEISVHASQLHLPIMEFPTRYGKRRMGSSSKLRTMRDAFLISQTFLLLFRELRPVTFYGFFATILSLASIFLTFPLIQTYMETGYVPRFPTAILATGMMLLSAILLGGGLVLESIARARLEHKRLVYLSISKFLS